MKREPPYMKIIPNSRWTFHLEPAAEQLFNARFWRVSAEICAVWATFLLLLPRCGPNLCRLGNFPLLLPRCGQNLCRWATFCPYPARFSRNLCRLAPFCCIAAQRCKRSPLARSAANCHRLPATDYRIPAIVQRPPTNANELSGQSPPCSGKRKLTDLPRR